MKDRADGGELEDALARLSGLSGGAQSAPDVALVLGSGLGKLADTFTDRRTIAYTELPGMCASTVVGHAGRMVQGTLGGRSVIAMQGRVHLYEGHSPAAVVFGVRLMLALGARTLIVTNAAGGIAPRLTPGTLMSIEDQLNLTGCSPLVGPNDAKLGPRFPDMTEVYDRKLREHAAGCAQRLGITLASGVYAGMLGPSYETPAEVRMLRTLGADAVGMSTVLETIAARHMNARCLGISCITNSAAGLSSGTLNHEEVEATARRVEQDFIHLLTAVVQELPP